MFLTGSPLHWGANSLSGILAIKLVLYCIESFKAPFVLHVKGRVLASFVMTYARKALFMAPVVPFFALPLTGTLRKPRPLTLKPVAAIPLAHALTSG